VSQVKIKRNFRNVTVAIGTATGTSTTLRTEDMAGALVYVGTQSTNATTFQVWGANTDTGTFCHLYDATGAAADITLAPSGSEARGYALPDAAYAAPYVKLVAANAATTVTAAVVTLKS